MNPNALRQYLELYDKQGLGGSSGYNGGFDPYGALDLANKMNGANASGARQMWAERMASQSGQGQQAPDFFSQPGPTNYLSQYQAPQYQQPYQEPAAMQPGVRDKITNYLTSLMGRR